MKKIIYLIIISVFISNVSFTQELGLEGKRFSIETDVSTAIFVSISNDGYVFPALRTNLFLNYTISRKNSIGLILSNSWYGNNSKFRFYNSYNNPNNDNRITHTGIGFKYSFFSKDFISPVGSSFSLYFKYNTTKNNYYDPNYSSSVVPIPSYSEFKISNLVLGVSFEKRSFLTSKVPLYFKYGFGFGYPVINKFELDGKEIEVELDPFYGGDFIHDNVFFELIKLNFGVGYIF